MRRKMVQMAGLLALLVLLAGCAPMNGEAVEEDVGPDRLSGGTQAADGVRDTEETAYDWESEVERLKTAKPSEVPGELTLEVSPSLKFDTDILLSGELEGYKVQNLTLTRQLFDVDTDLEKLLKLLGNPEVAEVEEWVSEEPMPDGSQEVRVRMAKLGGDNIAQIRDGRFWVSRLDGTIYQTVTGIDLYSNWYGTTQEPLVQYFEEDGELSFLTAEKAKTTAEEFLASMGIENLFGTRCFALSKVALQEAADERISDLQETGMDQEEIDALPKTAEDSDEAYFISLNQGYQGIPFYMFEMGESQVNYMGMVGTKANVMITSSGIVDAEASELYELGGSSGETEILSLGELMELFIGLHQDDTAEGQLVVRHMGLSYLPILTDEESMTFETMPIYFVFYDQPYPGSDFETRELNVFDAKTGERIQ